MNAETKRKVLNWAITIVVIVVSFIGAKYGLSVIIKEDIDGPCGGICGEDTVVKCIQKRPIGVVPVAVCMPMTGGVAYVAYPDGTIKVEDIERFINEHRPMEDTNGETD